MNNKDTRKLTGLIAKITQCVQKKYSERKQEKMHALQSERDAFENRAPNLHFIPSGAGSGPLKP